MQSWRKRKTEQISKSMLLCLLSVPSNNHTFTHERCWTRSSDLEDTRFFELMIYWSYFPSQRLHFFLSICLFLYLWLCWVFVSVWGLSPVAASGGHSSLRCAGLSLSWPLLLRSTGSRRAGSAIVAHGLSCSAACGIFPDQGSNPCPPHWQADSQPLRHQGSPGLWFLNIELARTLERGRGRCPQNT